MPAVPDGSANANSGVEIKDIAAPLWDRLNLEVDHAMREQKGDSASEEVPQTTGKYVFASLSRVPLAYGCCFCGFTLFSLAPPPAFARMSSVDPHARDRAFLPTSSDFVAISMVQILGNYLSSVSSAVSLLIYLALLYRSSP